MYTDATSKRGATHRPFHVGDADLDPGPVKPFDPVLPPVRHEEASPRSHRNEAAALEGYGLSLGPGNEREPFKEALREAVGLERAMVGERGIRCHARGERDEVRGRFVQWARFVLVDEHPLLDPRDPSLPSPAGQMLVQGSFCTPLQNGRQFRSGEEAVRGQECLRFHGY